MLLCLVLAMPGWGRAQTPQEEVLQVWVTPSCQVEVEWEPFSVPGVVKQVLRRAEGVSGVNAVDVAYFAGNKGGSWLDSEVKEGFTYMYQLQGRNAADEVIVRSQIVTVSVEFVPLPPSAPKAEIRERGVTYLELAWEEPDPREGIVEYVLKRYHTLLEETVTLSAPTLSFRDEGLQPGTGYQYELVARNSMGSYSPKVFLAGETLPVPPVVLEVKERGFTWLQLGWEPVAGLSLRLQRYDGAGGLEEDFVLEEENSYLDEGLKPGFLYTYRGGFLWEEEIYWAEEPLVAATLAPPGDLEATVGEGAQVQLTWEPLQPGEIVGQRVYRSPGEGGPWELVAELDPEVGAWVEDEARWNGTYAYKLELEDSRGGTAWTDPVFVSLPAQPPDAGDHRPGEGEGSEPGVPEDGDDPDSGEEGNPPEGPGEGDDPSGEGEGSEPGADPAPPEEEGDPDPGEEGDSPEGPGEGDDPSGEGEGSGADPAPPEKEGDPDPGEDEDSPGQPGEGEESEPDTPEEGKEPAPPEESGEAGENPAPGKGDSEGDSGTGSSPGGVVRRPAGKSSSGGKAEIFHPSLEDVLLREGYLLLQLEDLPVVKVHLSRELLSSLAKQGEKLLLSYRELAVTLDLGDMAAALGEEGLELELRAEGWKEACPLPSPAYRAVTGVYTIALSPLQDAAVTLDLAFNYGQAGVSPQEEARLGIYRQDPGCGPWNYVGGRLEGSRKVIQVQGVSAGIYTVMTYSPTFAELDRHWARLPVEVLASRHLWPGEEDFRPHEHLTRAEFTGWLARVLSLPKAEGAGQPFPDVLPGGSWVPEIAAAKERGLVSGRPDGFFYPTAAITRQEMAHLVGKVLLAGMVPVSEERAPSAAAGEYFTDWEQVEDWARPAIEAGTGAGLLLGRAEGVLLPQEPATRAEGAVLLARLLALLEDIGENFPSLSGPFS